MGNDNSLPMETIGAAQAVLDLYQELIDRYRASGVLSNIFESEFINKSCWMQRACDSLRQESEPHPRGYINYHIEELCRLEKALSM